MATPYGQHQLKAKIYGGVVDELTAEDSEVVLTPDVPYEQQEELGKGVIEAYELRDEAMAVEEQAVRFFEERVGYDRFALAA